MAQKRCPYCGRWFRPAAGRGARQNTCGAKACRREHKNALNRRWWADDPVSRQVRYEKVRDRRRQEGYWDGYRARNPGYVERNRTQTRERMRALRHRRKEDAQVLADPVEYLEGLGRADGTADGMFATQELAGSVSRREEGLRPSVFATQELVAGLSVGMWRYLKARERFATRESGDGKAGGTV